MRAKTFASLAGICIGCSTSSAASNAEVVTLTALDGGTGAPVADGLSQVPFQVCVPSTVTAPLAATLTATLTASSGTWQTPSSSSAPGVFSANLSESRCATAVLVAPPTPGTVTVQASLLGYGETASVTLGPAPLTSVGLSAAPAILSAASTNLATISAVVRPVGAGVPSAGTTVLFTATPVPSSAYATVEPSVVSVSGTVAAPSTLVLGPGVQSVNIRALATTPGLDGGAEGGLTVEVVAADVGAGGVADGG